MAARAGLKRLAVMAASLAALGTLRAGSLGVPGQHQAPDGVSRRGGRLVSTLRSEPKTFNPLAADAASREVLQAMTADLVRVNRQTQAVEPALAEWWRVSPDGRTYTIGLRKGVRFSDGEPFDADDVIFSFQAYLDPELHSPVRDHLIVGGRPVALRKLDAHTVRLELAEPYGAGERLLDSIAMLPEHALGPAHRAGRLASAWALGTTPREVVGLGAFRLKEYVPGQRLRLERNPHYWKSGRAGPLPYLDELVFVIVPGEDAQVLRFQSGEAHVLTRVSADRHQALAAGEAEGRYRLLDLGPGLEYSALLFNLNDLGAHASADLLRKQSWFNDVRFRRAVSLAIDRQAIARLAYGGRATPVASHVTPGNRLWVDFSLAPTARDLPKARVLLAEAGFRPGADGTLLDPAGQPVQFSVLTSAGNVARTRIAALIQEDLLAAGMRVHVVSGEFRAMTERLLRARDYEAALLSLGGGDGDPSSEMNLWLSTGALHLWSLAQSGPATPWEGEIDALMRAQMIATDQAERRRLYHRVQRLAAEYLPLIFLASPNVLVGVDARLTGLRPGILEPQILWNVDEIAFAEAAP